MPKGKPHPRLSSSDDDEDDTTPLCELDTAEYMYHAVGEAVIGDDTSL